MKKILLFLLLITQTSIGFAYSAKGEANQDLQDEKLEYCYGVYHALKNSPQEIASLDRKLHQLGKLNAIKGSSDFKSGQENASGLSTQEKLSCYNQVYTYLAILAPNNKELNSSRSYCFGYLKGARDGVDYTDVFCNHYCAAMKRDNCLKACASDVNSVLPQKENYTKGINDGKIVNPNQYTFCVGTIQTMY